MILAALLLIAFFISPWFITVGLFIKYLFKPRRDIATTQQERYHRPIGPSPESFL